MMFFLFSLPEWATGFNFLVGVVVFLALIGAAFVIIVARGRTDVGTIQVDRANALEGILKIRDATIIEVQTKHDAIEDELESVTAEHRTLVGLKVAELMEFWANKETLEAENRDLKREIRILNKRKDGNID